MAEREKEHRGEGRSRRHLKRNDTRDYPLVSSPRSKPQATGSSPHSITRPSSHSQQRAEPVAMAGGLFGRGVGGAAE
jgi:hypothetical protein